MMRLFLQLLALILIFGCGDPNFQMSSNDTCATCEIPSNPNIPVDEDPTPMQVGQRLYMSDVLSSIYGPAAHVYIKEEVSRTIVHGGACDRYERRDCANNSSSLEASAPLHGSLVSTSSGYLSRACLLIHTVAGSDVLDHVLIHLFGSVPAVLMPPTTADISKMASLFYPDREISAEVIQSLLKVSQEAAQRQILEGQKAREAFLSVSWTLCDSGAWRIK